MARNATDGAKAMRLDDFDPNINVEDEGSGGGGGRGGFGGGGLLFGLLPLIGSRFGCGGIVVVLILFAVFGGIGNVGSLVGGGQQVAPASQAGPSTKGGSVSTICRANTDRKSACDAFSSADKTWTAIFADTGKPFTAPGLVFYSGSGRSGCGAAQSAMGPFYCPTDSKIYLDTSFFEELQNRFHAGGDFAQDYVIAHEFGHHIQNLLGVSSQVARAEQSSGPGGASGPSVRLELQADCYAGVWANKNKDRMDPGDVQQGMTAAHSIGDDTLQQENQGRVIPDSFTHGTSAQREHWLQVGLDGGDPAKCDTFSGAI